LSNSHLILNRIGPKFLLLTTVLGTLFITVQTAHARTLKTLYNFTGGADGYNPLASLVRDAKGNLYGTTYAGGAHGYGVVFEVTPNGTEKVLYNFAGGTDGAWPEAGLIRAGTILYGTTAGGGGSGCGGIGCGTVFKVSTAGKEKVLYSFTGGTDGAYPYSGLVRDSKTGNLYGTVQAGGADNDGGVFFITPSGTETILYSFNQADPEPNGVLVRDAATGDLYGTTSFGGAYNHGMVFQVTPTGVETVLYNFTGGADGSSPSGNLIRDGKGILYGLTTYGGGGSCDSGFGCGTVFEVAPSGTEKVLHSFTGGADGSSPSGGLVRDAKGNLYGATTYGGSGTGCSSGIGCGTVFEITPAGTETLLYTFAGTADGGIPRDNGGLALDAKTGNLYGTATSGGSNNAGVVFMLTP
jgi:uncharacterized repeat protein (TIGR03803 family)